MPRANQELLMELYKNRGDNPFLCEHANECPVACPCLEGCYCKTRTCKEVDISFTDTRAMPPPIPTNEPYIKDLVLKDFVERAEFGFKKYNTYLQPNNGRDALIDAYHEAMDLTLYLRQELYKKYGK